MEVSLNGLQLTDSHADELHEDFGDFIQGQQQPSPPHNDSPWKPQRSMKSHSIPLKRSALDIAADKVLDWLAPPAQPLVQASINGDSVAMAISGAWESALGLMGGETGLHNAEVARRLCGVLDTLPTVPESEPMASAKEEEEESSVDIDTWLDATGGADKTLQRGGVRDNAIDSRIAELVWPEHSQVSQDNTDDSLVAAYLRLAEMSTPEMANVHTSE
ncbi:hypothetical protein GGF44_000900 [Coemansia sp. RSA 1694]|nr:hypothetical protein GGF44_000900 [Coemansia sp. RSA 1694]